MHKRHFNEAVIELTITPTGPILIKAGEGVSDPTKPDMSFVRTLREGRETVYLPGSSLKGVLRAHCERLARTVQGNRVLACNPLHERDACGMRLEKEQSATEKYRRSCFLCRLFGNTVLSSHFRISDAHPLGQYRVEERNGVAIDRVFGSVAHGPFNYETVTTASFQTTLFLRNFTMAQIGLLALALRDLTAERVRLGFAKSRGLGTVTARVDSLVFRYPLCEVREGRLRLLDGRELGGDDRLFGVGEFVKHFPEDQNYGYSKDDAIPRGDCRYETNDWDEVEVHVPKTGEGVDWQPLGRACVNKWREEIQSDN